MYKMGRRGNGGPRLHLTPAEVIALCLVLFFTFQIFSSKDITALWRGGEEDGDTMMGPGGSLRVSTKSHAYLRSAFWDRTPDSFVADVSKAYEPKDEAARKQLAGQQSFYADLIQKYLAPWKGGISEELIENAANLFDVCDGDMFRFQILNGTLWVHHITERRNGWYPAVLGPKNVAAKGRVPYALLALMDTLRMFPGQIPDMDAVMHLSDFPCISRKWAHGSTPMPILGYQGSVRHHDLPFPDHTYWGHEHQFLLDPWGRPAHGWANQAELLSRKYANVSLLERVPQAMWRGRTKDKLYPFRDKLRRVFVGCADKLRQEGRHEEADLISVVEPPVPLQDTCDYRYNVYIESHSYASNLKQKLACGSVLVALRMEYWDFYAPALHPGQHYVEVTNEEDHVCEQVVEVTRDMNAMFDTRGWRQLSTDGEVTPTLAKHRAAIQHDRQLAEHDHSGPGEAATSASAGAWVREPFPRPGGNYSWGSALMPWEIAAKGQQFVQQHVRMEDVLLYIRDLLRGYASLQRFTVKPLPNHKAACYTGDLLLEQFGTPHKADGETVATAYPWLKGYDAGCEEAEARYGR